MEQARTPKQWCEYAIQETRSKLESADVESHIDAIKLNKAREKAARLEEEIAKLPSERDWRTDLRMLGVAQSLLRWSEHLSLEAVSDSRP